MCIRDRHEADEYQKIVDAVLAIDEKERDYEAVSQLAVSYTHLDVYKRQIRNCVTAHGGWPARIHAGNASRILTAPDFYTGGGRSIF